VVVGYADTDWTVSASRIMFREVEIRGSLGCRPVDYPPLLRMVEKGIIQIKPIIDSKRPLDEINEAFKLLEEGKVLGRIIIIP
ncbi:MAG: alcohol dehydrogenase, partial [Candidatus Odinarchaeota archaeon]